uniref:Uncharacterized protein n=1 Tax=Sexangularia sp. CB-2014 TaxID=1486929 RepID=A0A7S1YDR4_9EUKA|mmetsp:Transcript_1507/g.4772  ORF Transcript_1507/g.4772 Transcript_1507/m.4772 type:complete len:190 (+) Transcript_1507:88-657(+)
MSVVLEPSAIARAVVHSFQTPMDASLCALCGTVDKNTITISHAIPLFHSIPPPTMVETALALVSHSHTIVGFLHRGATPTLITALQQLLRNHPSLKQAKTTGGISICIQSETAGSTTLDELEVVSPTGTSWANLLGSSADAADVSAGIQAAIGTFLGREHVVNIADAQDHFADISVDFIGGQSPPAVGK